MDLEILIKNLRNSNNIKQDCKRSNLSRDTYYRLMNNKVEIYLVTFFKIATFLQIHPASLLKTLLNYPENKLNKTNKEVTFQINISSLSKELQKKMNYLREEGKSIDSLFNDLSKNNNILISQRHFSNVLTGKKISLKIFLYTCKILKICPIELLEKITIEKENKIDGTKTNA